MSSVETVQFDSDPEEILRRMEAFHHLRDKESMAGSFGAHRGHRKRLANSVKTAVQNFTSMKSEGSAVHAWEAMKAFKKKCEDIDHAAEYFLTKFPDMDGDVSGVLDAAAVENDLIDSMYFKALGTFSVREPGSLANQMNAQLPAAPAAARPRKVEPRKDLSPGTLASDTTPAAVENWVKRYEVYYESSNFNLAGLREQQMNLLGFLENSLRERVQATTTDDTPIFRVPNEARDRIENRGGILSVVDVIKNCFKESLPIDIRRENLFSMKVRDGEPMTDFMLRVKSVALQCDLQTITVMDITLMAIMMGCTHNDLRKDIRRMENKTWENVWKMVANWQTATNSEEQSTYLKHKASFAGSKPKSYPKKQMGTEKKTSCYRCGASGHKSGDCKIDKEIVCNTCGKKGHMKKACRSGPPKSGGKKYKARQVTEELATSDDEPERSCKIERVKAVGRGGKRQDTDFPPLNI